MNQNELLKDWLRAKTVGGVFRWLTEAVEVEFEFRSPRMGYPSNYASVRFSCRPALELDFASEAKWPQSVSTGEIPGLELAICRGIIDVLMCEDYEPYRGCSLILRNVGWDDVSSSERAFYVAARGAMEKLLSQGKWDTSYGAI